MSSYWRNEEKIKVSQTQVSIPSTNGRSYSATAGTGGRRIDFEIPPSVKFMDGKNSYLQFDVKLGVGANPTRLQLDPFIGGQSLVKNLRIMDSQGTLLEEISDYNAKVQIQYSYDSDDSLKKMRALKEGCLVSTIGNGGTLGTSVSNNIDLYSNPYYKPVAVVPPARDWGTPDDFLTAKVSLPIHSGIFADSSKIFPVMLCGGLRVEIDMEDPARCIKQLDSVNRHRRMKQNPIFHGIDAIASPLPIAATDRDTIYLGKQNNMRVISDCPFVKGERIGLCSATDPTAQCVLTNAADVVELPTITNISVVGGYVVLTTTVFRNQGGAAPAGGRVAATNDTIVYSAAADTKVVNGADVEQLAKSTKYDATVSISNAALIVQQVQVDPRYEAGMMSKMREGGAIEIDIHSVTNYKHSLLKSNRNGTINLASSNTRVKSSIIMITDAETYDTADLIGGLGTTYDEERTTMDGRLHSIRSGQVGIIDELTSYNMLLDDKLIFGGRPIVVSKINKGVSISAQPLTELEKALNQAKITPRSFVDYNRNFLIGRAYGLYDGVANLNNKTNQLQLLYNESSAAGVDRPPKHDKLIYAFQFHLRRIIIKGDSVSVML
tara:strand:- start:1434 stop:3254 length:1821 start_codon:yes stop_codon:yes gene_type:complete